MKAYTKIFLGISLATLLSCTKESDIEYPSVPGKIILDEKFDTDAVVKFSQIYKATGTNYTNTSTSLNGISLLQATNISITPANQADLGFPSGSITLAPVPPSTSTTTTVGAKVILKYVDDKGKIVSIPGITSRTCTATNGIINAITFAPTIDSKYDTFTKEAFLLVVSTKEAAFTAGANVNTTNTPTADNFLGRTLLTRSEKWKVFSTTGVKTWVKTAFKGDGYATFSSFGSSESVNIAWMVSPTIDMNNQEGEKLFFQACQDGFIKSADNSLELYVSTDFDGVNFNNASWEKIDYKCPSPESPRFIYENSPFFDLSKYKGNLNFAFKIKGTTSLSGGYQIDNIRVFY